MIKAIILDVDGVIVGKKEGVNFPLPNDLVIQKLKELHKKNIAVVLCTVKFNHAIGDIIKEAGLDNPHITDGGALIINPLKKQTLKKYTLNTALAKDILSVYLENDVYVEAYAADDYFLQKNQISEFTKKRIAILQKKHKLVNSLTDSLDHFEVIKILAFAKDEDDKPRVEQMLAPFKDSIHFVWSKHPSTLPVQVCAITFKGASKKLATFEVLQFLNVSSEETLGIGDTSGDWEFMNICKYVATVGDHSQELKNLAKSKGEGKYFLAPSVDEDGFLAVVNHFLKI